jgi:hypothetical protein
VYLHCDSPSTPARLATRLLALTTAAGLVVAITPPAGAAPPPPSLVNGPKPTATLEGPLGSTLPRFQGSFPCTQGPISVTFADGTTDTSSSCGVGHADSYTSGAHVSIHGDGYVIDTTGFRGGVIRAPSGWLAYSCAGVPSGCHIGTTDAPALSVGPISLLNGRVGPVATFSAFKPFLYANGDPIAVDINSVAFSDNGAWLAVKTRGRDSLVRIDWSTGEALPFSGAVRCCQGYPDQTPLAVDDSGQFVAQGRIAWGFSPVTIWDIGTCAAAPSDATVAAGCTSESIATLTGRADFNPERAVFLRWTEDGLSLAAGNQGSSFALWRLAVAPMPKNDPRNVPVPSSVDSDWWTWPDADADGIPDKWEAGGVWVDGQFLDLPSVGADPRRKDLFVHVDYTEGRTLDVEVFELMIKAFDEAPLSNPDGTTGVTLHVDGGRDTPRAGLGSATWGDLSSSRVLQDAGLTVPFDLTSSNMSYLVDQHFRSIPRIGGRGVPQLFKYVCDCPAFQDGQLGEAWVGGGYGAVSISGLDANRLLNGIVGFRWPTSASNFVRASTITHELGHSLGLRHHGAESTPEADPDYKSVMSYAYNVYGVDRRIDYSRTESVNLDWRVGDEKGALTFVPGQFGERPDFYETGSGLVGVGEVPDEPTVDELLAAAPEEAKLAFLRHFATAADLLAESRSTVEAAVAATGVRRSLIAKVDAAVGAITSGDTPAICGALQALIAEMSAQRSAFASPVDHQYVEGLVVAARKLQKCR